MGRFSVVVLCCTLGVFGSCSEELEEPSVTGEATEGTEQGVDDQLGADGSDATEDGDQAIFGGTISGNVFWNLGEITGGRLLLGLTATNPASAPLDSVIEMPAELPTEYTLVDVPEGDFFLVAFLDLGEPDTWDAPGQGDYLAVTEHLAGVTPDSPSATNINIELR